MSQRHWGPTSCIQWGSDCSKTGNIRKPETFQNRMFLRSGFPMVIRKPKPFKNRTFLLSKTSGFRMVYHHFRTDLLSTIRKPDMTGHVRILDPHCIALVLTSIWVVMWNNIINGDVLFYGCVQKFYNNSPHTSKPNKPYNKQDRSQ